MHGVFVTKSQTVSDKNSHAVHGCFFYFRPAMRDETKPKTKALTINAKNA